MMKINTFLMKSALVILLIINFLSVSCKKDTNDSVDKKYRINKRNLYDNDTLTSSATFWYENDQISTVKYYYYSNKGDSIKTEIEYPDENTIAQESYFYYAGIWYPIEKYIIENLNGKIVHTESFYFDGSYWNPAYKEEYQYTDNNLSEEVWFDYEYGVWTPDEKITYEYYGNLPIRATYYDFDKNWQLSDKEEASYTGDKIDRILSYTYTDDTFTEEFKYEFDYNGSLLTRIDIYYYFGSVWDTIGVYSFTYDSYGNLVSEAYEDEISSKKIEYGYEKGQGNYRQLLSPGGGLISYRSYPSPTKSCHAISPSSIDLGIPKRRHQTWQVW